MLTRVHGATLEGVEGVLVSVEVEEGSGLPSFQIVGQADRVVNESRDRIRSAFRQLGIGFPKGRVTVNLAPTGVPKAGSSLDLPIAVAIAATQMEVEPGSLDETLFIGELGLDGALRGVRGALALVARGARAALRRAVVPEAVLPEAAVCPGIAACGAARLADVLEFVRSGEGLTASEPDWERLLCPSGPEPDLADVRGQEGAKRALEIAAAGGHNAILLGPPGSGKTLLARRLPGLLPDLRFDAALEATQIHSVAGSLGGRALLIRPPFQAPHHTTSDIGMIGGGRPLRAGEISLAHRGVLFLDELPEFRRSVLEALRQPLEEGEIRVVRAHAAARLPARFQLVAAMNPCPCGYWGDPERDCTCDDAMIRRYRSKLSGPLLDRIDLHVAVPRVAWREVAADGSAKESTAAIRARVQAARERQERRYRDTPWQANADLPEAGVRRFCGFEEEGLRLLERAVDGLGLSMRAYVRLARVARTIADLATAPVVAPRHVAEAIAYRLLDRQPT